MTARWPAPAVPPRAAPHIRPFRRLDPGTGPMITRPRRRATRTVASLLAVVTAATAVSAQPAGRRHRGPRRDRDDVSASASAPLAPPADTVATHHPPLLGLPEEDPMNTVRRRIRRLTMTIALGLGVATGRAGPGLRPTDGGHGLRWLRRSRSRSTAGWSGRWWWSAAPTPTHRRLHGGHRVLDLDGGPAVAGGVHVGATPHDPPPTTRSVGRRSPMSVSTSPAPSRSRQSPRASTTPSTRCRSPPARAGSTRGTCGSTRLTDRADLVRDRADQGSCRRRWSDQAPHRRTAPRRQRRRLPTGPTHPGGTP